MPRDRSAEGGRNFRRSIRAAPLLAGLALLSVDPTPARAQSPEGLSLLEVERVERMLEGRIACRGCHVIASQGGLIGPVLDGIAERADLDYVRAVVRDPTALPSSLMPHQPMAAADAERLARYVHSQSPRSAPAALANVVAPAPIAPGRESDGAALYARHCAACHGESGAGDGWNAPNLPVPPTDHSDATLMSLRPDDTLYDGIAAGGWVLDRSARMPAFGALLDDAQIRALVAHIRQLCRCAQPEWAGIEE